MKNIQRLNILIEQAVKKSLSNHSNPINEAAAGWSGVSAIFKNSGLKPKSMFGSEYYIFNDPDLGIIEFFEDGEAVIKSPLKRTTWTTTGGELFVDGEKIEIKKVVQQRKREYQQQQQRKTKRKAIQTTSSIDKFQTALDWLGLIPGFGDILDAINAIIYFARGKYMEGMLSLIAIIPVVGSGLKLGYKGIIESAGGALAMRKLLKDSFDGNPDKLIDIYKNAIRDGKLDKLTLKQLADKGDAIAAMLLSGKNWMKAHPTAASVVTLGSEKQLFKYMDDVRSMLKNHGKVIDDAIEEGGETIVKRGIDWAKGFYGAGTVLSAGVLASARNFLVKTFGFKGSRQMQLLKKALDAKFIKQVSDNPTIVSQMYKMNPIDASRKAVYGIPNYKSPKKIKAWLDTLKATNPVQYSKLSKEIAQNAANNKNFYYMKYVDNSFQAASMTFKPGAQFKAGAGDIIGRIFQLDTYRLSNPKNLDIVYNEFNDLAEKIGYDKTDDPNGVILPAIYAVFTAFLGDPMSKINAVTGTVPTEKPGTKGPVDDTGQVPGGTEVQDPIVAGQDKIKLDFKDMDGRTTDRLRKLEDLGYTEEQVTALKQELGIE
jgi:hypothetical protein